MTPTRRPPVCPPTAAICWLYVSDLGRLDPELSYGGKGRGSCRLAAFGRFHGPRFPADRKFRPFRGRLSGLALAAPLFAWGGYLWMTSMGDPNRSAAARNCRYQRGHWHYHHRFLFHPSPGGQRVRRRSRPVGIVFEREPGINCDGMLRQQLIINGTASTPSRMNFLVERIQEPVRGLQSGLLGRRRSGSPFARVTGDQCDRLLRHRR